MEYWKSDMEKIYIPVHCPECNNNVSISGNINDNTELELEDCPVCGHGFVINVASFDELPTKAEETCVSAEIKWIGNDPRKTESSWKLGEFDNVIELFDATINCGCVMFGSEETPPTLIKDMFVKSIISEMYTRTGLELLIEHIKKIQASRQDEAQG